MSSRQWKVPSEARDKRLDLHLTETLGLSRSQVQKIIAQGGVHGSQQILRRSALKLKGGEFLSATWEYPTQPRLLAEPVPLAILYEDKNLLVLNKPAGLVVHPGNGQSQGTLVNALLAHCGTLPAGTDPTKPGIVHRLDKGTSGVMVVAKTELAMAALLKAFKERQVKKKYLALVHGHVAPQGTIETNIGRHYKHRQKFSSKTRKGKPAVTHWKVLEYFGETFSWVGVRIETGRTHQIRVHFAESGHPVVGDPTYGQRKNRKTPLAARPMLHAWKLGFPHPVSQEELYFTAPLPKDIESVLQCIRK